VLYLLPIIFNLFAVVTGIRAVGTGRDWDFNLRDVFKGDARAKVYVWLVCSTAFSMVHFIALITQDATIIGYVAHEPVWLFLHTLIGLFFSSAHLFVDAVFEDRKLCQKFLGTSP
jgi:hypothetical protein